MPDYHFKDFIGKKVLIMGEVGSGKTTLISKLLSEAAGENPEWSITVIDMAPPRRLVGGTWVGGGMNSIVANRNDLFYLALENIHAPRIEGNSKREVIRLAKENTIGLTLLIESYLSRPAKILFINDLTIYFHAGDFETLLKAANASETFIGNAYFGTFFMDDHGSNINKRERHLLERLWTYMDIVINLS